MDLTSTSSHQPHDPRSQLTSVAVAAETVPPNAQLTATEYRLLVEHSPVMIWRSGRDKKCDYFNHVWLEFTGRTMAQESATGGPRVSTRRISSAVSRSIHRASISGCRSKWNTGCAATMACIAGFSIAAFLASTTRATSSDTSEAAST